MMADIIIPPFLKWEFIVSDWFAPAIPANSHGEVFLGGRRVDGQAEDDGAGDSDGVHDLLNLIEARHKSHHESLADCVGSQQHQVQWRCSARGLREAHEEGETDCRDHGEVEEPLVVVRVLESSLVECEEEDEAQCQRQLRLLTKQKASSTVSSLLLGCGSLNFQRDT
jgi:hypothetical protein